MFSHISSSEVGGNRRADILQLPRAACGCTPLKIASSFPPPLMKNNVFPLRVERERPLLRSEKGSFVVENGSSGEETDRVVGA